MPFAIGTGCVGSDASPCAMSTRTTDFEYYTNGLPKKIIREPTATATTGLKATTEFIRDAAGLVTSVNYIPSETGAATRTERMLFDESGANVVETSNALGHKTWFMYLPRTKWLYAIADQNGPADKADLLVTYDNLGRVRELAEASGSLETINYGVGVERRALADGPSSATFFDERGRPVIETWTTFAANTSAVQDTVYDSLGHPAKTQYKGVNQAHATLSATEASARAQLGGASQRSAASYDAMGRLSTSTNGLTEVTTFGYPSPLGTRTRTDPSGNVDKTFTDHNGRVRSTKQTLAGTTPRDLTTTYGFDDKGLLTHVKSPPAAVDLSTNAMRKAHKQAAHLRSR